MENVLYLVRGLVISILILIVIIICIIFIARRINANRIKITTENGMQQNLYVEIGKIKQYLQIRGKDKNNPIILFLHGGPGNPNAYIAPYYQKTLEKSFTFVNWDQRGSGRTFFENPHMNYKTDISPEIMINDIDEIISYLSNRFGQKKIILMGHSWGTVLGTQYCLKYPDKISAYIGIGQSINAMKGEELAFKTAIDMAQSDSKIEYINNLQDTWNKISRQKNVNKEFMMDFIKMRKLIAQYLTCSDEMSPIKTMWLYFTSSEMSLRDLKFLLKNSNLDNRFKYGVMLDEYVFFHFDINEYPKNYQVPVYFISGDSDCIPPHIMIEEYFNSITAPDKKMFLIKKAGHLPFLDNPKDFCEVVEEILKGRLNIN
ncbi:proline iminopeptidase [Vallitalea longa]|uniref:Proline iminopeptidase n=1 Tax=Vallitalea longa TaxID=2936439 RepID=A0A9W5YBC4_9FIRM|nr:alpha/beta hydrolase [Vallitalea longa]GKX29480.1 proline iminopeptidase [Vallitalea longa]